MRTFTGAFLGTIAALLFVAGIVSFLAWREVQKLESATKKPRARVDENAGADAEKPAVEAQDGVSSPVGVSSPTVDRN